MSNVKTCIKNPREIDRQIVKLPISSTLSDFWMLIDFPVIHEDLYSVYEDYMNITFNGKLIKDLVKLNPDKFDGYYWVEYNDDGSISKLYPYYCIIRISNTVRIENTIFEKMLSEMIAVLDYYYTPAGFDFKTSIGTYHKNQEFNALYLYKEYVIK